MDNKEYERQINYLKWKTNKLENENNDLKQTINEQAITNQELTSSNEYLTERNKELIDTNIELIENDAINTKEMLDMKREQKRIVKNLKINFKHQLIKACFFTGLLTINICRYKNVINIAKNTGIKIINDIDATWDKEREHVDAEVKEIINKQREEEIEQEHQRLSREYKEFSKNALQYRELYDEGEIQRRNGNVYSATGKYICTEFEFDNFGSCLFDEELLNEQRYKVNIEEYNNIK